MKVAITLDLTEHDRRAIRAAIGRGGMATRQEARIFIARAIRAALDATPEPVRRAPRGTAQEAPGATTAPAQTSTWQTAKDAPLDAVCAHCGTPKRRHGKLGFTCPPVDGAPRGRRFTPVQTDEATE